MKSPYLENVWSRGRGFHPLLRLMLACLLWLAPGTPVVAEVPSITAQPLQQTVYPGISATFRVTATGSPPLSYQWRKGGVLLPEATGAEFSIPAVQAADAALYDVFVTNAEGTVPSEAAELVVRPFGAPGVGPWTTFAGAPGGVGAVDATGADARFAYLQGVAVGSGGTLYVADTANHAIRKITADGVVTTLAGSLGTSGSVDGKGAAARFFSPQGIAVLDSTLYVADTGAHTIRKITLAGTVTTLAGSSFVAGSNDGTGTVARFNKPYRIAAHPGGYLLVADYLNHAIRKLVTSGSVTTVTTLAGGAAYIGSSGDQLSTARFNRPSDLAVDSDENIYVLDSGNKTVRKIDTIGAVTVLAGSAGYSGSTDATGSDALFEKPIAIAVGPDGMVYVADGNRVRQIDTNGAVTTLKATGGFSPVSPNPDDVPAAQFAGPQGLAVVEGTLFVGDTGNSMLRSVTLPDGSVGTVAGASAAGSQDGSSAEARFFSPRGLAADALGNVYVADSASHTIRKIDEQGVVSTVAGLPGTSGSANGAGNAARFNAPQGIVLDLEGNLLVADTGNHLVRKVSPDGNVTTLAGTGGAGRLDGVGTAAEFRSPRAVAQDPSGNIYVADSQNFTIRKILPSGEVTTLAGLAGNTAHRDGTGGDARFTSPTALVVDANGVVSVTDGSTVRRISADGVVTTLAGIPGSTGSFNGNGTSATFSNPEAIAQDFEGNLYVADTFNHTIRKLVTSGSVTTVTTLAGGAGKPGGTNGTSAEVRFAYPTGLALDATGNLFVADRDNAKIRLGDPGNRRIAVRFPPLSTTAVLGGTAAFSVNAKGPDTIAYQWRRGGVNIPGATSATYVIPLVLASDAGQYDVVVDNASSAVVSSPAALEISGAPLQEVSFLTQPASQTRAYGNPVLFSVSVGGTGPFTYQWRKDGAVLVGATGSSLGFSSVDTLNAGSYDVVVSNPVGSKVSAQALLKVEIGLLAAVISASPTPQKAVRGAAATFSVSAAGTPPLTYQWRKGGVNIAGATAATYTVASVQEADLGEYSVQVNAAAGDPAYSAGAALAFDFAPPAGGSWFTFAGPPGGPGNENAEDAASASFNYPRGVARAADGTLYIADTRNHTVRKMTADGAVSTLAGSPGVSGSANGFGEDARFNAPHGIALDSAGTLYVADTGNHTIRRITSNGEVTLYAGTLNKPGNLDGAPLLARFNAPQGLAFSTSGTLYVADTENSVIRAVTSGTAVVTLAGNANSVGHRDSDGGAPLFNKPTGLALDDAGNLYVADAGNKVVRKIDPATTVTTVAGLAGNVGTDDDVGTLARFINPVALASDAAGNLLVLDGNRVRSVSTGSLVTTLAGTLAAGIADGAGDTARFSSPLGIASDGEGGAFIADTGNSVVRRIDAYGNVDPYAGTPNPGAADSDVPALVRFRAPRGLARDALGNIYVADSANHAIRKVSNAGATVTLAGALGEPGSADGTAAVARFNAPEAVAIDASGTLFVADTGNHVVRRVSSTGTVTLFAGSVGTSGGTDGPAAAARFRNPRGIAVDSVGNVYVADSGNFTIRKITPAGEVTTLAGATGVSSSLDGSGVASRFLLPVALAVDATGRLVVADGGAIRTVSPAGDVSTLAGSAGVRGTADGLRDSARFGLPQGVAWDATGAIYVADTYNHTIRKVLSTGMVTTVAGAAGVTGSAEGAGSVARFAFPWGILVDASGNLQVSELDGAKLRFGLLVDPLEIQNQPVDVVVLEGKPAKFEAKVGSTIPFTYQWRKAGVDIPGATGPVLELNSPQKADMGRYSVKVSDFWSVKTSMEALLTVYTAAEVAVTIGTQPPVSTTVLEGGSAGFGVVASSLLPLRYQWSKNGVVLAGGTSEFFFIPSATFTDAGTYSVVVSTEYDSVTSTGAALVVNPKPPVIEPVVIINHPQSLSVREGGTVVFEVVASGPAPLSYQWRKDGVTVAGATGGSLSFSAPDMRSAGSYDVVVSSSAGSSATSDPATLTVAPAGPAGTPFISIQPLDVIATLGSSAEFRVVASGAAPLRYQWRKNGEDIPSANYLSYRIRSVTAEDLGAYDVVVSNTVQRLVSKVAALKLPEVKEAKPVITQQPLTVAVYPGVSATFRVGVKASPTPTFQWRKDGVAIPGATSDTYSVPPEKVAENRGRYFDVVVSNALGSVTSVSATLSPKGLPTGVGTWKTLAGNPGGRGFVDDTGPAARFVAPDGIAMDRSGNLYVSDGQNYNGADVRIRKITAGGVVTTVGVLPAAVLSAAPLVVAPNGDIYTIWYHSVYKVTSDGFAGVFAGDGYVGGNEPGTGSAARFGWLRGITMSPAGDLYVTDADNHLVWKITPGAVATRFAGSSSRGFGDGTGLEAKFADPWGIKSDALGNLYVADRGNDRVRKITPDGVVTTFAGSAFAGEINGPKATLARFNNLRDVALDGAGNVYVVDQDLGRGCNLIRKIGADGMVSNHAGSRRERGGVDGPQALARFAGITSIVSDLSGNCYVVDADNYTIRKITPNGVVSTLAGLGGVGTQDGVGEAARFDQPEGITTDAAGNVYVADTGSDSIRRVTPEGVVTTIGRGLAGPRAVAVGADGKVFANSGRAIVEVRQGLISPLAGDTSLGGTVNARGSSARFNQPMGLAVRPNGTVLVTDWINDTPRDDTGSSAIRQIDRSGNVTDFVGTVNGPIVPLRSGGTHPSFREPHHIALDPEGNLFVADSAQRAIRKVSPTGAVSTVLATPGGYTPFFRPYGVAVTASGTLYVADTFNGTVHQVSPEPSRTVTLLKGGGGWEPRAIATDGKGRVYVAEQGTSKIKVGIMQDSPLAILAEPAGGPVTLGGRLTLSAAASGTEPITYQWRRDGVAIPGATTENYTVNVAQLADSGTYDVVIANGSGAYTSKSAQVSVAPGIVEAVGIRSQPANATVSLGAEVVLSVEATGTGPVTYQWRKDGVPIQDALDSSYVISEVTLAEEGKYYDVVVTNAAGSVLSEAAQVSVLTGTGPRAPVITKQPVGLTVAEGDTAEFVVRASGTAPLRYQWRRDGAPIPNANYLKYKILSVSAADVGRYDVVLSDSQGATTSAVAVLSLPVVEDGAPEIIEQPVSAAVYENVLTTFRVRATGLPAPTFQWRKDGNSIPGATTATYTLSNPVAADAGSYDVVVTNTFGTVTSTAASLSFKTLPTGVGTWLTLAGNPGEKGTADGTGAAARFFRPAGVALDQLGNVYVSEASYGTPIADGRIRKITPGGAVTTIATLSGALANPTALVVSPSGDVFACAGQGVVKITDTGVVSVFAGKPGESGNVPGTGAAARFGSLRGITMSPAGDIYVTDPGNVLVWKITGDGVTSRLAGGTSGFADGTGAEAKFSDLQRIKADAQGNLYVGDYHNRCIRKITPTGTVTTVAGRGSDVATSAFELPLAMALDGLGNLFYVCQSGGGRLDNRGVIRKLGADGQVSNHAGMPGTTGSADGTREAARFGWVEDIVCDVLGTCYVADATNATIRKITPEGVVSTLAGVGGVGTEDGVGTAARFYEPQGIAVDVSGNVYVADTNGGSIRKVTAAGVVTTLARDLGGPVAIAVNGAGEVFTNDGFSVVQIFANGGKKLLAGLPGTRGTVNALGSGARFGPIRGIVLRPDGSLLVMDQGGSSGSVRRIDASGIVSNFAGNSLDPSVKLGTDPTSSTFAEPNQIALDAAGNLFVADTEQGAIRKVSPSGVVTTVVTSTGTRPFFFRPRGVAVTASGTLYVVDDVNDGGNRIKQITPDGEVTEVPGSDLYYGAALATDPNGNVYVAERGNSRIRMGIMADTRLAILSQPVVGGSVAQRSGMTLRVEVSGTGPITYQWRKDGVAIAGATANAYTIGAARVTDAGVYDVVIANGTGPIASVPVNVSVTSASVTPVSITSQPNSMIFTPGSPVLLRVEAGGTGPVVYQWRKDGVEIPGANGTEYVVQGPTLAAEGYYDVVVGNEAGSVLSEAAQLVASRSSGPRAPVISGQPEGRSVAVGTSAEFVVAAKGTVPVRYQWRRNGVPIANANYFRYRIPAVGAADAGNYDVVVSDALGSTSSAVASLEVTGLNESAPVIIAQPADSVGYAGVSATFRVAVTGYPVPTFQWRKNGKDIERANGATYTIASAVASDVGSYDVVVSNPRGSRTSEAAVLRLEALPPSGAGIWRTLAARTDEAGTPAQFNGPSALAFDAAGNLFVSDSQSEIRKITPDGLVTTLAGTAGMRGSANGLGALARFNDPDGMCFDGLGNMYVADSLNHTIRKVTAAGQVSVYAGAAGQAGRLDGSPSEARFADPDGVAIDAGGNIYVADTLNHTIRVISAGGAVRTLAGLPGSPGAVDGFGNVARFNQPYGIALDVQGNAYVTDDVSGLIRKVTPAGVVTTLAGGPIKGWQDGTGTAARFLAPVGITVDPAGNLYVVDRGAGKIRQITPGGTVTTIAGKNSGTFSGYADGPADTVSFNSPTGIALDANGAVYVADSGNNKIRVGMLRDIAARVDLQADTLQPARGGRATLTARVTGTGPLAYQWRKDGVPISGGTAAVYQIASAQDMDIGLYDVVVANAAGAVSSGALALSLQAVDAPIAIATQPVGAAVTQNSALNLLVTAAGRPPFSYQWRKEGVEIPGANGAIYAVPTANRSGRGYYDVVVSNAAGIVLSEPAFVEIVVAATPPPVIQAQPLAADGVVGGFVTFQVAAEGTAPLRYQWRKGGTPIRGATAAVLTVNGLREADAGVYDVQVSNGGGLVTSQGALLSVTSPVVIVSQPEALTVAAGQSAVMSVVASGGGSLSYQWRKDGQAVAGGDRPFYVVAAAQAADAGVYDVVVSNASSSLSSKPAELNVGAAGNGAIAVVTQPANTGAVAGARASLRVSVTGSGPISYQWFRNGTAVAGANEPVYRVEAVQVADVGSYFVRVANGFGTVDSASANLGLYTPVVISTQPLATAAGIGAPAELSVVATGTEPLTYQWRKDGQNIPGGTQRTYTVSALRLSDAGTYSVVVSNPAGAALSAAVALRVGAAPVLVERPVGGTVVAGGFLPLSVGAIGEGLTYQWLRDGRRIPGANASVLMLQNLGAADAGRYTVVVANPFGSVTSSEAVVAVNVPARFVRQPEGTLLREGASTVLSVQVAGSGPLSYQWRRNGGAIPGATQFRYTLANASEANAGDYDVVVKNPAGEATSAVARVGVSVALGIVRQPVGASVTQGSAVSLSVQTKGSGTIRYAWHKWPATGNPVVVGTLSSLSFPSAAVADAGTYSVLVTGNGKAVFSDKVELKVSTERGIVVLAQPAAQPPMEGGLPKVQMLIDGGGAGVQQTRYTLYSLAAGAPVATAVAGVVAENGIVNVPLGQVAKSGTYAVQFDRSYTDGGAAKALTQPFYVTVRKPDVAGAYQGILLDARPEGGLGGGALQTGWVRLSVNSQGSFSGRVQYVQAGSLAGAPSAQVRLYQPVSRSFSGVLRPSPENSLKQVAFCVLGTGSEAGREQLALEVDQSSDVPLLTATLTGGVSQPLTGEGVSAAVGLRPGLEAVGMAPAGYASVVGRYTLSAPEAAAGAGDNNAQLLVQVLSSGRAIWVSRLTGYSGSGSAGLAAPAGTLVVAPVYGARSTADETLLTTSAVLGELRWTRALDGGWDLALGADRLEHVESKVSGSRGPGGFAAAYTAAEFAGGTHFTRVRLLNFAGALDCRIAPNLVESLFGTTTSGLTLVSADPLAGGSLGFRWNVTVSRIGLVQATGVAAGGVLPPALSLRVDRTSGEWIGSYTAGGVVRSLMGCVLDVPESRGRGWFEGGGVAGRWELRLGTVGAAR